MSYFADANLAPLSERAKASINKVLDAVRIEAYDRNRTSMAKAEAKAPGKFAEVVGILLANATVAHMTEPGQPEERRVVAPLGRKHYRRSRYLPESWSRPELIDRALRGLVGANLVNVERGIKYDPRATSGNKATEYVLRPAARQLLGSLDLSDFGVRPGAEVVVLKDKGSDARLQPEDRSPKLSPEQYVDYPETPETTAMRGFVRKLNEHMARHPVVYDGGERVSGERVCRGFTSLRRVFNRGSFEFGGRYFGHWAQQAPREARRQMTIGGKKLVEVDLSGSLVSLLYHACRLELPEGDAYDYGYRWSRDTMKRATLALILRNRHSKDFPEGVRTEEKNGVTTHYFSHRVEWRDVERAILQKHAALVPFLFKPCEDGRGTRSLGLRLMRRESDVLTLAMEKLLRLDIGFVPIHDGILCPESRAQEVEMALVAAYRRVTGHTPRIKIK